MLFSVRLVSRQPGDVTSDAWQALVADQLHAMKTHYDQGRLRAVYRETGAGVLAIFDVAGAQEMDQYLAQMPLFRYFVEVDVHALWDMAPTIQSLETA
jgi:muconolactone delta-isomerase